MKFIRGILAINVLLFGSMLVWAEDNHYFGIAFQGGYATMHPFGVDVKQLHGMEGGGALLYEYERDHFLMNIGAGFNWQQAGWKLNDAISLLAQSYTDSQGDTYVLHTTLKRRDEVRRGTVEIPVLFGGQWGMGYVLAGVKVGFGLIDRFKMCAEITTTGQYDHYIVPIHDAGNHGFYTDAPVEQEYTFPTPWDVRLTLEGGVNVARVTTPAKATIKVRLGAYVDYGIYLTRVDLNSQFIQHTGSQLDLSSYQLQPILTNGSHYLDNLSIGLKLTVLIGAPGGLMNCPTCRILDTNWKPYHTKKRCIVCERGY